MRSILLVLVLCSCAQADRVPNEIEELTWPVLRQGGATLSAESSTFATAYNSSVHSTAIVTQEEFTKSFTLLAMAAADTPGSSAETIIDATLFVPDIFSFSLSFDGPGDVRFTGPGVDHHLNYGETINVPRYFRWYDAGEYHLVMTQTVPLGIATRATAAVTIIIPEPSTWVMATLPVIFVLSRAKPSRRARVPHQSHGT